MKPVLAHVITGLNTGGAEMMLSRILEQHDSSQFRPIVYCLTDEGPIADRIRSLGIPVRNLGMRRGLPNPLVVYRLARELKRQRAVVVQTWLYHADLIGGLAARLARVPVAWGIHNSLLGPDAAGRSLRAVIQVCRRVARVVPTSIVCCAESARDAHTQLGYPAGKMTVISNGFDLDLFRPDLDARARIRAELGVTNDTPLIGIAGRFVPLKNHRLFVAAAGLVATHHPNARFVMAGEGLDPANTELSDWIDQTGLRDRVYLLGRRADMPAILAALDIVALTSQTEAFPLVIGEAMATAVPCVSTDVGDARQLIGDTGRVTPRDDAGAFAAALADLLDVAPARRHALGCRARERMAGSYEIGHIARRYEELWTALASGARPCD